MDHLRPSPWVLADNLAAIEQTNDRSLSDIRLSVLDSDLMVSRRALLIAADHLQSG